MAVAEGELLWTPSAEFMARSQLTKFMAWLRAERGLSFDDYEALRKWSVTEIEGFWAAVWDYFEVMSDSPPAQVLDRRVMPGAKWFEGSRVNYAEHLLRYEAKAKPGEVAIHHRAENRPLATMSWQLLGSMVRKLATKLRELGISPAIASCPTCPTCRRSPSR